MFHLYKKYDFLSKISNGYYYLNYFFHDFNIKENFEKIEQVDLQIEEIYDEFLKKKINIPNKFLTPRSINKNIFNDADLNYIFDMVKKHMNIKTLTIFNIINKKNTYKNTAGFYENAPLNYKAINLIIKPHFDFLTCASIIIHELSHCFMEENKFKIEETLKNERKTDLITIFLGFEFYLKRTYGKKEILMDKKTLIDYHIGYLNLNEIYFASKKIKKIIKNNHKNKIKDKEIIFLKERITLLNNSYKKFQKNYSKIAKIKNIEF
ncbi:MAG: hypothetical protein ACRC0G_15180, partial [Fusobacteriaceae bacterium]